MPIRLKPSIFSFGLLCLLTLSSISYAQDFSTQHWYFGNNGVAVEFTRPNDVPVLVNGYKQIPFNVNNKGNATANRPETGDLLFYTDGFEVFDVTYGFMDGISIADKLNADVNKNQSVALATAPQAGANNLYYIFTNTATGVINYSEVDMTSNGNATGLQPPLGSVISRNNIIANSTANASDAMLIISDSTNSYWLITLDVGTNNYKVLGIDSSTPASWIENTYNLGTAMDAAHIAYSPDSSKIAVAPKDPNINIQLLDIDLATGVLTFDREIPNTGATNVGATGEAIFDVEFSNDGSKLYYSIFGDGVGLTANLMQFDLMDTTIVLSPQSVIPATIFGSYGLQKGPDGLLYHLYQATNGGPFLIGSLTNIDSIAGSTAYTPAIENGQDFNSFQFPAFLPNRPPIFTNLTFTTAGNCANAPTTFYPNISPAPTSVQWDFGDGSNANDLAPFYTYMAGGAMNVTMRAELNGRFESVSLPISITDFQVQLTLNPIEVACKCELEVNRNDPECGGTINQFQVEVQIQNDPGNLSFTWSNGDTGPILEPDSAGYYYVVATDGTCSTYAGVQVQEYDTSIPGIAPSQRSNIWYFGTQAGIDFNNGAIAITDGAMDAMEGCTAVSDLNGQIIFYTDGDVLFDQTHNQIDSGLGGTPNATDPAAQSVIAVAVPGDETLFYIFTTESNDGVSGTTYNFSYSLFDLKENNGLGRVVEKNVILFEKSTERITASANWAIIHEFGNNNFRAYPIGANGIGNPIVSSVGEDYSMNYRENGRGYMKLGGTNLGLAVVENNGGVITNYLDVFDFDATTGEVSNLRRADLTAEGASGMAYGIEFVGAKIFISLNNGGGSQIMEYWIDFMDNLNLNTPIMTPGVELGAIQTGPDGQVYVAENGVSSLGTIAVNGDTAQASNYSPNAFPLAGRNSQLGLPNFVQQTGTAGLAPGISVSSPACIGQPIFLSANVTSTIDSVDWQITDPSGVIVFTSTNLADTLTLNTAGDYIAALLIYNRCLNPIGTFSEIITISPPPPPSDLPVATFLCGPNVTLPVYNTPPANIADLDFAWSTGETTSSITVSATGNYDVIITDRTSGCATTAATFVGPPIPIDLGPDQTICESDALTLDSQINADTYVWTINGIPQLGTRFFDVGAQNLVGGIYTIQVDATIDLGGSIGPCTVIDQVIITVNPAPVFTAIEGGPASCGNPDGSVDLTLTSLGSYTYDVAGVNGIITDTDPMPLNILGIAAGVNALTLTNNVTGCTQVANVAVTNPTSFSFTVATANDETCITGDGSIDYTIIGAVAAFTARAIDITDPSQIFTANETGIGSYTIPNIPEGIYTLEILETTTGCIEIWIGNPETVPPVAQQLIIGTPNDTDLTITQNPILECGTSINFTTPPAIVITTNGAAVLEWSDDAFATAGNPIATVFTTLGSTTVSFRASATAGPPETCEVIETAEVVLTPTPTVSITLDDSDICNGNVTLTANGDGQYPTANLGYRWSSGETTQSITVNQVGTTSYTVTAFHTINQSCLANANEQVTINPAFTVGVTSTLACDDGQPFTLSAVVTGQSGNQALAYRWFLDGQELTSTGSIITALNEGEYRVDVEDTGSNCSQSGSLVMNRIPLTPTNLSSAPVFCPNDSVLVLDAGPNFIGYLWSDGSIDQTLQVSVGGLYEIEATNSFGCVTRDQSEAIEDCIPLIDGPNAFRPGGLNSTYSLFTQYIDTFEIFIYNRWGELVYSSTDAAFAWDGTEPSGEQAPVGQYSWVVRYTSSFRDRGTLEQYGGVVLLR
ncbi:MAG: gliding motility-associated C-terminal domain-containing protein [Cyclobacteriaceae bacterium]|nr:gliding motility-associated C-terminal domain-containing protein [Cyclobacteriaceae bacterium]